MNGFKYDFDVYIDVTFDEKAHEEYSFFIHAYGFKDKAIITKKSAKTVSFNKCMSWIYAAIRKIVDAEFIKIEAKYLGYIDTMTELAIEQKYYESNRTTKPSKNTLCVKLLPSKQCETKEKICKK